jgi:hypothetical protein
MNSTVETKAKSSFASLFISILIPTVLAAVHRRGGIDQSRTIVESSLAMMQSVFLPDALIKASLNHSEEWYYFHDEEHAEQLKQKKEESAYEVSKLPTLSILQSELEILLRDSSLNSASSPLVLVENPDDYFEQDSSFNENSPRRMRSSKFCDRDCSSRSRQPSNPDGHVMGSYGRWS